MSFLCYQCHFSIQCQEHMLQTSMADLANSEEVSEGESHKEGTSIENDHNELGTSH